ncbi:hypothetical protein U8527_16480 [Kordia algicida OT-1]|uniref:Uncharacterized protein n=1 Tax=Kordia algicida OT-1 TaxID=391587 RepID=A9EAM4_9FLAO|nr:hypothetical protein [Kordia algicida]EDP94517.1 hypothetical protein KAOT1_10156 [Kordia algicida OT-1]
MKRIQKFALAITVLAVLQISAQNTSNTPTIEENETIENFQLPTFSELSNNIATDYSNVRERLPNLSNIGEHVQKGIRRGLLDDHSISATFRNLSTEHSILPNITPKRFQLRNNLNNIMFNGFDVNQLHLNGAYKQ